ncbi:hypothetical protein ACFL3V_05355 [Nanoarchaeota archaeon]
MNIKRPFTIFIIILLVIVISGCKGGAGGFFKGKTDEIETYNFRSGTDGVVMKFVEGMPPKQFFVGTDFTTGIRISNMGAHDITDKADIKILLPDKSAFSFGSSFGSDKSKSFMLTGKSLYIKEGQEDVIMFPMKALCFPGYDGSRTSIITNYSAKMQATACYYYETTANVDLCVDTLKFKRQKGEEVVCDMKTVSLSGGQGGPVGVVSISPMIIPQGTEKTTLQLGISVKKLKGMSYRIFHPDQQCDIKGQNQVQVSVMMGKNPLQCSPAEIKIKEKDAVGTICKVEMSPNIGAFKTPITVNMRYYVQHSIFQDIHVEPPPGKVDCAALKGTKTES